MAAMKPQAGYSDFLCLLGVVTSAIILIMLGTGLFFEIMNARHP